MPESYLNREVPREPNYGIPYALYLVLRRQPWRAMAAGAWNTMKRIFQPAGRRSSNAVPPAQALQ